MELTRRPSRRAAAAAIHFHHLLLLVIAASTLLTLPFSAHCRVLIPEGQSTFTGRGLLEEKPALTGKAALIGEAVVEVPKGCSLVVGTPAAPTYVKRLIAEPHKPTTFDIAYTCLDGTQYVTMAVGPYGQVAFGSQVALTYTKLGLSKLKVYVCPKSKAKATGGRHWCAEKPRLVGSVAVTVVYVRREIRGMSPADRQDYFDAIKTMGNTSTGAGRKKYGAGFFNYYELVARHASFVFTQPCDLAHLGPAFSLAHRAFAREFERSVQSVKPHVATPYWDYIGDGDLADPTKTALWTNEYYGSLFNDEADGFVVKDGQFAHWKVPTGAEAKKLAAKKWGHLGPAKTVNPWGFFRGAENMNKAKYLTRMGPGVPIQGLPTVLPTSADWAVCRDVPDFTGFVKCVDLGIHGGPHSWIAGNRNLPTFEEKKSELDCSQLDKFGPTVCKDTFTSFAFLGQFGRNLFHTDGCLICNKTCTLDQPIEECNCQCSSEVPRCSPDNMIRRVFNKAFYGSLGLGTAPVPPFVFQFGAVFGKYGLCGNEYFGDYGDVATATLDPIFWPHHTNIDRVLVSWRYLHPGSAFETSPFTTPSNDSSKFPDFLSPKNILQPGTPHPGVSSRGDGNPSGVCRGHGLNDQTCLGAFSNSFRSVPRNKLMTNLDLLKTVDVQIKSPDLANYIYDTLQL